MTTAQCKRYSDLMRKYSSVCNPAFVAGVTEDGYQNKNGKEDAEQTAGEEVRYNTFGDARDGKLAATCATKESRSTTNTPTQPSNNPKTPD